VLVTYNIEREGLIGVSDIVGGMYVGMGSESHTYVVGYDI
jgi:hypothetical protein